MIGTPRQGYHDDNSPAPPILPALRELLGKHQRLTNCSAQTLAGLLWELRYFPWQPADHEVEAALEVLRVEGEVLA